MSAVLLLAVERRRIAPLRRSSKHNAEHDRWHETDSEEDPPVPASTQPDTTRRKHNPTTQRQEADEHHAGAGAKQATSEIFHLLSFDEVCCDMYMSIMVLIGVD